MISHHICFIPLVSSQARVLCQGITNCFTFFLFAILTISAINFFASLFLPPPLSGRHILWLSVFVAPGLSLSLVGTPGGSEVMRWSTGKNTYEADRKVQVMFQPKIILLQIIMNFEQNGNREREEKGIDEIGFRRGVVQCPPLPPCTPCVTV